MADTTSVKQEIQIPQLGEGMTTVRIVELHKQTGESVSKDEVLYTVETDKTTVDIESPCSGRLVEWLVEVGAEVAVGEPVANILTERQASDRDRESQSHHEKASDDLPEAVSTEPLSHKTSTGIFIPPRIRAFCREHGIEAEEISTIAAAGNRLTMEMVEHYLFEKRNGRGVAIHSMDKADQPLSNRQRWLNEHFKRSQAQVIPATLVSSFNLTSFGAANKNLLESTRFSAYTSEFQLFAYWVSRVAAAFPHFKSRLINDNQRREYRHVNLGIAVQTEKGELVTAAIKSADTFAFTAFIDEVKSRTKEALQGHDQATDDLSLILSYTGGRTTLFGTPLLVSPAIATLFLAIPDHERRKPDGQAYLSLTFDHRLINGIEATAFLDAIAKHLSPASPNEDKQAIRQTEPGNDSLRTRESLEAALIGKVADLLAVSADEIDDQESLGLLGLDSIKALALKDYLEQLFSTVLPATLLWHCPNVKSLLDYCLSKQKTTDTQEAHPSTEELGEVEKIISELEALPASKQRRLLGDSS